MKTEQISVTSKTSLTARTSSTSASSSERSSFKFKPRQSRKQSYRSEYPLFSSFPTISGSFSFSGIYIQRSSKNAKHRTKEIADQIRSVGQLIRFVLKKRLLFPISPPYHLYSLFTLRRSSLRSVVPALLSMFSPRSFFAHSSSTRCYSSTLRIWLGIFNTDTHIDLRQ